MQRPRVITEDDFKVLLSNMKKVVGSVVGNTSRTRPRDEAKSAGSNPALLPIKREYDSKWEETYAAELVLRKHAGLIKNYWYHPFSMWLPGKVRYTPDFMIEYPAGIEKKMDIIDVKGWHKNLRAAMVAIRVASGVFPCYTWVLVKKKKGGGWDETSIG